jgi:TRAP-type transport system small permease protein
MPISIIRALDAIAIACGWISRVLLAAMTAMVLAQVCTRYVFGFSFKWSEELARYLMVWMVMLSASVALRDNAHIRVDFFTQLMPPRLVEVFTLMTRVAIVGYLGVLTWQGWQTARFMEMTRFASLDVSMYWAYLALPVGGGLMLVFESINILRDIAAPFRRPAN